MDGVIARHSGIPSLALRVGKESPHGDRQFEFEMEAILHARTDEVDEAQDIAGRGAGFDDDVIRIPLAYLGGADLGADQPGLFDQYGSVEAGGVLEDARCRLVAERLGRLELNP